MESNDELDRRIDDALAGYADAEPLEGLEGRVMRRVRAAGRRRAFGWAAAMAAAVVVLMTVIVARTPRVVAPKSHDVARVETVVPPRPTPVAEKPRIARRRRVNSRIARLEPLPKLEQFPAPTPLTEEERALAVFVARYPKEAQQAFADLRKRSEEPVEIKPIEIPPLPDIGAQ